MLWELKPKPDLEKMREEILERGQDPSLFPILNDKPELFPDLRWIWEGFMSISASRQIGMSAPQPILLSEILAYCEYTGIFDSCEREELLNHVQKLDIVFRGDFAARNPSPSSDKGN